MARRDQGEFSPGDAFGSHRIVRWLGSGAFGEVYEAANTIGFRVAIKTLKRDHARRADLRARFLREGLSAVKIRHPNAVQVLDTGEKDDVPYLVMEFLDGEDLDSLLKRVGHLSPAGATDILLPAMAAVAAAHDEGVIHRDLKPANLFLAKTRDGEVVPKVVDFGISRLKDGPPDGVSTRDDAMMGSPVYMSPEQTRGASEVGDASDQFSLGTILYECVTGRRPFEGPTLLALLTFVASADFPPPRSVRPEIPADFEAVLLRAMSVDPANRFPSVRAFGAALLPFASPRVRANFGRVFDPMGASTISTTPGPVALRRLAAVGVTHAIGSSSTIGGAASSVDPSRRSMAQPWVTAPRTGAVAVILAVGVVLCGAMWIRYERSIVHAASRYPVLVEVVPAVATIVLDGRRVGEGRFVGAYVRDGRAHQLSVTADGYEPYEMTFVDTAPAPRVVLHHREPMLAAAAAPSQPTASVVTASALVAPATATAARSHRHHQHHDGHESGAQQDQASSASTVTGVY